LATVLGDYVNKKAVPLEQVLSMREVAPKELQVLNTEIENTLIEIEKLKDFQKFLINQADLKSYDPEVIQNKLLISNNECINSLRTQLISLRLNFLNETANYK